MITFPFFVAVTLFLSNVTIQSASHTFPTDMRDSCSSGTTDASLASNGKFVDSGRRTVFDEFNVSWFGKVMLIGLCRISSLCIPSFR